MQVLHIIHLKITVGRGVFEEIISCIKLQLKSTNFSGNASMSKSTYPNSTSFQFEFAPSLHGSKHRQGLFRLLLWAAIKSRQIKISTSIWHIHRITFRLKTAALSDPGSKEGICAGLVSSTSLRSLWASFRKSAMCTWSFLRSTASIATSLFTAVMKASSESSVDDVKDSDRSEKLQTGPFKVCRSVNRWSQLTSLSSTELFLSLCQLLLHLFQFGHLQKNNQQLWTRAENRFFL